jgi:hypothetical protein
MVQLNPYQINNLCMTFAELGAAHLVKKMSSGEVRFDPKSDRITQNEAFGLFGKGRVLRWKREGGLTVTRSGKLKNSKLIFSRAELITRDTCESQELRAALSTPSSKENPQR